MVNMLSIMFLYPVCPHYSYVAYMRKFVDDNNKIPTFFCVKITLKKMNRVEERMS